MISGKSENWVFTQCGGQGLEQKKITEKKKYMR